MGQNRYLTGQYYSTDPSQISQMEYTPMDAPYIRSDADTNQKDVTYLSGSICHEFFVTAIIQI